jgi:hypothetical protein
MNAVVPTSEIESIAFAWPTAYTPILPSPSMYPRRNGATLDEESVGQVSVSDFLG